MPLTLSLSKGSRDISRPEQLLLCFTIVSAVWKKKKRGGGQLPPPVIIRALNEMCSTLLYLLGSQHIADKHVAERDVLQVAARSLRLLHPGLREGSVYSLTWEEGEGRWGWDAAKERENNYIYNIYNKQILIWIKLYLVEVLLCCNASPHCRKYIIIN